MVVSTTFGSGFMSTTSGVVYGSPPDVARPAEMASANDAVVAMTSAAARSRIRRRRRTVCKLYLEKASCLAGGAPEIPEVSRRRHRG
jgi:hypothetical protein